MHRLVFTFFETAAAAVFLMPLFFRMKKKGFHNPEHTLWYVVFGLYLCGVYAVAGLPNITYYRFDPNCNFTLFQYMFSDLESTVLNVILFLPIGAFPPILWRRFRSFYKVLLLGLMISILIELLQIFTFRATDINDLMTNTTGTILGYGFGRLSMKFFPLAAPAEKSADLSLILLSVFATMFFLQPLLSNFMWQFIVL